jgi:hypothetical protein
VFQWSEQLVILEDFENVHENESHFGRKGQQTADKTPKQKRKCSGLQVIKNRPHV